MSTIAFAHLQDIWFPGFYKHLDRAISIRTIKPLTSLQIKLIDWFYLWFGHGAMVEIYSLAWCGRGGGAGRASVPARRGGDDAHLPPASSSASLLEFAAKMFFLPYFRKREFKKLVRRGSDSSASACCKAGPTSYLDSAPQRKPSTSGSHEYIKRVLEE